MADGIIWNLASKALQLSAKTAATEIATWLGARDDLEKLEDTIRMIQARVGDAERHQEGEGREAIKEWLRRLKMVLYRAEDLFEKVLYVDHQKKQLMERSMLGKVGILFSKYGPLYSNAKLADEIKSIRILIDAIKSDMNGMHLPSLPSEERPIARLIEQRETISFVDAKDVAGREDDQNKIMEMLFDPKYEEDKMTVISIVGFGGLGKTTLAQLVFNHHSVKQHFDLTKWAYVPEIGNKKLIMGKILTSFTDKNDQNTSLDKIQKDIRQSIEGKKYLLVLDDLWDEDVNTLTDLERLLKCGKQGSKVIVTTRSDNIARYFGPIEVTYKLGTLTDHQSWELFKTLSFKQQDNNNPSLRAIGEEIVKMCRNVPLVIKVVGGSLISKHTTEEWLRVKNDLSKAQLAESNEIMVALKLSYNYLLPQSKLCFAYCSLFPKGYEFVKDDLVQLWMAQGYVEADNGDQYFWDLVARNLFQGPKVSDQRDIMIYKMHDLLHDLANEVARGESMLFDYYDSIWLDSESMWLDYDDDGESTVQIPKELVHVNLCGSKYPTSLKVARRLRSLLCITYNASNELLHSQIQSLRVLSMETIESNKLPNFIERLIHLRYLDLGNCYKIKYLPNWIARLENLQTLKLQYCKKLQELPRDFVKLTNLQHLLLPQSLTDLPAEFGKMTSLQELNRFIVGRYNGLDSLRASWNHRGRLDITFHRWRRDVIGEVKRANLKDNHQLTSLTLNFDFKGEESIGPGDGGMLESLQLPLNLIHLRILNFEECQVLPYQLSQLPLLKSLQLKRLSVLEYVEDRNNTRCHSFIQNGYFRSLEVLELEDCYKLKRWARWSLVFPSLLKMKVSNCQNLMSMPLAPKLESLTYMDSNGKTLKWMMGANDDEEGPSSSSTAPPSSSTVFMSLKELEISRMYDKELTSLSISSRLCNLSELRIFNCSELRIISFESPNSIRTLDIRYCRRLRNMSVGLQHLSKLEELCITGCEELEMEKEEEEAGKSRGWQGMTSLREMENLTEIPQEIGNPSWLRKLYINKCPKMKSLPPYVAGLASIQEIIISNMKNLTELPDQNGNDNIPLLRKLMISSCPKMKTLPRSLLGLASLQFLQITDCPELAIRRYMPPNGEYSDLIDHIPDVKISDGEKEYTRGKLSLIFKIREVASVLEAAGSYIRIHNPQSRYWLPSPSEKQKRYQPRLESQSRKYGESTSRSSSKKPS